MPSTPHQGTPADCPCRAFSLTGRHLDSRHILLALSKRDQLEALDSFPEGLLRLCFAGDKLLLTVTRIISHTLRRTGNGCTLHAMVSAGMHLWLLKARCERISPDGQERVTLLSARRIAVIGC